MKAGTDSYYLSCYLAPPGRDAVLGTRHDQNVSLWRWGPAGVELLRLWELERVSGQKHHHWPLYSADRAEAFLTELLAEEQLGWSDITAVWGTPGLPRSAELSVPVGAEHFAIHSLGHLFSGLLMDSELFRTETIVGMAVDAAPDFVQERSTKPHWFAGCVSQRGRLTFAPVQSPASLYSACEQLFDKEPGTLMALASACPAELDYDIEGRLDELNLLGGRVHPVSETVPLITDLVAAARRQLTADRLDSRFTDEENLQSAVMAVVQRGCDHLARRNVLKLCELAGVRPADCYLSMTGGFALNCPTNSALLDDLGFKGLLTPPCANDSGQSYGLGLLGFHGLGAFGESAHRLGTAYHGSEVRDLQVALSEFAPWIEQVTDFDEDRFVRDVSTAPLAWVDGAAEIGPRALCHRSLLGDPRSPRTKDLLNNHKLRQWWRPVAPVVLAEHAAEWFSSGRPSPYMLQTVQVLDAARDRVPAILHLDGSARHQTLTEAANPLLYRALSAFHRATGVPILCNTSLNDKGEPIVDNAAEAITFCLRKGISVAYVQGSRIALRTVPADQAPAGPRPRRTELFTGQEDERDRYWARWAEAGYTVEAMFLLTQLPELRNDAEFTADDVNALAAYVRQTDQSFPFWVDQFVREQGPAAMFGSAQPMAQAGVAR